MKKLYLVLMVCCMCVSFTGCASSKYNKAVSAYDLGDYDTAITILSEITDYEDSQFVMAKAYLKKYVESSDYILAASFLENCFDDESVSYLVDTLFAKFNSDNDKDFRAYYDVFWDEISQTDLAKNYCKETVINVLTDSDGKIKDAATYLWDATKNDEDVITAIIESFKKNIFENKDDSVRTLYKSFASDISEIDEIVQSTMNQNLQNFAAGTITYEQATKIKNTCNSCLSTASSGSFTKEIEAINDSKISFAEAEESMKTNDACNAYSCYEKVISTDIEHYDLARESMESLVTQVIEQINTKTVACEENSKEYFSFVQNIPQSLIEYEDVYSAIDLGAMSIVDSSLLKLSDSMGFYAFKSEFYDLIPNVILEGSSADAISSKLVSIVENDLSAFAKSGDLSGYRIYKEGLPTNVVNMPGMADMLLRYRDQILKNIIQVSKIWSKAGWAGSIDVFINFTNKSDKTIKYARFVLEGFDSVGDEAWNLGEALSSNFSADDLQYYKCSAKGPFNKGEGLSGRRHYWYFSLSTAESFKIHSLTIEYMDGTEVAISDPGEIAVIYK